AALGSSGRADGRAGLTLARSRAGALQDAAFALWRSSRQLRGTGLGILQAGLVAMAVRAHRLGAVSAGPLRLRRVQGGGVALVAFRHPVRRRAPRIDFAARRALRPLLENDRMVRVARRALGILFWVLLLSVGEDERRNPEPPLHAANAFQQHAHFDRVGARLSRLRSFPQCGHARLSAA